ncbi:aprataxin-like protein [Drosophila busckii]|uniref:aprataxin-like protein n=1 Tax=Drosophila busckii TaxID=30019 RepID=UPI0014329C05|nr:aprataxin-like protein [Drosophila busckii]
MQQMTNYDIEQERELLTRMLEAGKNIIIETDQAAVLRNVKWPKAEFHYIVMPKAPIARVTALKPQHLPLLDHMMELANQIIEKTPLPPNEFRIGFEIDSFMNRLNMHVISNDFHAFHMQRIEHWNIFNTELFIDFQAVCALLLAQGSVEPMSAAKVKELLLRSELHCNRCEFVDKNFSKLKAHLYQHWTKRRAMMDMTKSIANTHLDLLHNHTFNARLGAVGVPPRILVPVRPLAAYNPIRIQFQPNPCRAQLQPIVPIIKPANLSWQANAQSNPTAKQAYKKQNKTANNAYNTK